MMNAPTTFDLSKSLMDVAAAYAEWSRVLPSLSREEALNLLSQVRIPLFEGAELRVVLTEADNAGESASASTGAIPQAAGPSAGDPVYSRPDISNAAPPTLSPVPKCEDFDADSNALGLRDMSLPGLTRADSEASSSGPSTPIDEHIDLPVQIATGNDTNNGRDGSSDCDDDRSDLGEGFSNEEFGPLELEWRRAHPSIDGSARDSPSPSPILHPDFDHGDVSQDRAENDFGDSVHHAQDFSPPVDDGREHRPRTSAPLSNGSLRDAGSQGIVWCEGEQMPDGWDRYDDFASDTGIPTPDERDEAAYERLLVEEPEDIWERYHALARDVSPRSDMQRSPPSFPSGLSARPSSKRSSPTPEEDGGHSPKRRRTPEYHASRSRREPSPPVPSSSRLTQPPSPRRGSTWDRRRSRHRLMSSLEPFYDPAEQPTASSSRHRQPSPHFYLPPPPRSGSFRDISLRYPAPEDDFYFGDDEVISGPSYTEDNRRPSSPERFYGDYYRLDRAHEDSEDFSLSPPRYRSEAGDERLDGYVDEPQVHHRARYEDHHRSEQRGYEDRYRDERAAGFEDQPRVHHRACGEYECAYECPLY